MQNAASQWHATPPPLPRPRNEQGPDPGQAPVDWAFVVLPAGGRGRFRTADICFVSSPSYAAGLTATCAVEPDPGVNELLGLSRCIDVAVTDCRQASTKPQRMPAPLLVVSALIYGGAYGTF
ncbi:hypothetical protein GCM10010282_63680 [Streptomyces roseolus]|nr:hypothetical protein GCM10010282_63680 [Streptomyces roseolus]